ncbi:M10 family metallopeptidase C-terminal domain-containing protein [Terasakiella sp.]|uniref:M10 family metallopeptidase C-terminal domain-containing protein n=1 Tax=Terasakiella sp. TaxID=2034861 RepID=UPI003B00A153
MAAKPTSPQNDLVPPQNSSSPATDTNNNNNDNSDNSDNNANESGTTITAATRTFLTGSNNVDTLTGSMSDDLLFGGAGNDQLAGGDGNDRYLFSTGFGQDNITDSAGTADKIEGFTIENLSNALRQGDDLILDFYSGDSLTLKNHFQSGSEVEILVSGNDTFGLSGQTSGVKGQILAGVSGANDTINGAAGHDRLFGGDGDDKLKGLNGNNFLDGGSGTDNAVFSGNFSEYSVAVFKDGYLVTDTVANRDGATTLKNIENLEFADQTLALKDAITRPEYVTGVLYDDAYSRWNADTSVGTSVNLTYSFMDNVPSYYAAGEVANFSVMSSAQEAAVRKALAHFSEIANITFTEVADTGDGGILRFGNSTQSTSAGQAYAPSVTYTHNGITYLANDKSGDVFIANNQTSNQTLSDGSHGYYTLLHEIGHATGLTHTFEGNNQLTSGTDSTQYSVMSYTNHPKSLVIDITGNSSYTAYHWNPESLMLYDVATMQHLYGSNTTTRTGNDTYNFDPNGRFIETIWDAGGSDTIDASNFTRNNIIDLTPGSFSSIGIYNPVTDQLPSGYTGSYQPTYSGEDNVAIAFGTFIENAKGGQGNDQLIGNFLNNTLSGGDGDDTLTGHEGNDLLEGGSGNDTFVFAKTSGNDTVTDSGGDTDKISGFSIADLSHVNQNGNDLILDFKTGDRITLKNHFLTNSEIEIFASGSDNFSLTGQTSGFVGQIIADPSANNDLLKGAAGLDYIFGADGDDTLQGGSGADVLSGGAGSDTFYFELGDGDDSIRDFSHGIDHIQIKGGDFSISTVTFETINAVYDGTNATSTNATIIRDSNNDIYVDNNGQTAGGYSHIANIENGVDVDENDFTII